MAHRILSQLGTLKPPLHTVGDTESSSSHLRPITVGDTAYFFSVRNCSAYSHRRRSEASTTQLGTLQHPLHNWGHLSIPSSTQLGISQHPLHNWGHLTILYTIGDISASSTQLDISASSTQLETSQHPLHNWASQHPLHHWGHLSILYTMEDTSASSTQLGISQHPLHNWGHFSILYIIADISASSTK
jgi:hypothetical protein